MEKAGATDRFARFTRAVPTCPERAHHTFSLSILRGKRKKKFSSLNSVFFLYLSLHPQMHKQDIHPSGSETTPIRGGTDVGTDVSCADHPVRLERYDLRPDRGTEVIWAGQYTIGNVGVRGTRVWLRPAAGTSFAVDQYYERGSWEETQRMLAEEPPEDGFIDDRISIRDKTLPPIIERICGPDGLEVGGTCLPFERGDGGDAVMSGILAAAEEMCHCWGDGSKYEWCSNLRFDEVISAEDLTSAGRVYTDRETYQIHVIIADRDRVRRELEHVLARCERDGVEFDWI